MIAEGSGTARAGVLSVAAVETARPGPPAGFSEMIIVALLLVSDVIRWSTAQCCTVSRKSFRPSHGIRMSRLAERHRQ